jgi:hypothetical protein
MEKENESPTNKQRPEFNYEVKNKKAFINSDNIKVALDYLEKKTPEDITKLRTDLRRSDDKDDAFISLYLANEALGKGKYTKERSLKILQDKLKIDPFKNAKFFDKTNATFNRKWEEVRSGEQPNPAIGKAAQNAAKEITAPYKEQPEQTPQPAQPEEPETSTGTTASTIKTEPEEPKPQQPEQPQPQQQQAQSNIDLTKPVDPQTAVARIKELKATTGKEIDDIRKKLETSNDLTAKMGLSKVLAVKKSFERKMSRYEREANAGPHSARKALNYAETDSQIAKHTAFKHTLKGTFRRGIGRMAETGQSMKNRVLKAGQNIKNKVETSETLKKVYGNIKPEMERAKERTTRGVEKVGQAYQKMDTEGRDLVKQYLPTELNRYLKGGDITRAILRRRAKAKRNQAMTPQQQPVQNNQSVPQLTYNKQGQKMLPKLEGLDISRKVLMHYTRNRI